MCTAGRLIKILQYKVKYKVTSVREFYCSVFVRISLFPNVLWTLDLSTVCFSVFLIFFCEDYIKIKIDSVYNYKLFSLQIIFAINYSHLSIILSVRSVVLFKVQSYGFSIKILVSMHFTVLHDFLN